jgi:UPF0042 nucleotide-binding protein
MAARAKPQSNSKSSSKPSSKSSPKSRNPRKKPGAIVRRPVRRRGTELVVITGMSGSGKHSVLKAFEDMGYFSVDNLPVELIGPFAELVGESPEIERAAMVVDVREGRHMDRLPAILRELKRTLHTTIVFLEASDEALMRRYSETRRPHPLAGSAPVKAALAAERKRLRSIAALADIEIDTTKFTVHELRAHVLDRFRRDSREGSILVSVVSFGYRHGVPDEADLVFDVRFLPNPHFVPEFRPFTGKHPRVAKYIRSFPQTREFLQRVSQLLVYLLPHYVKEGKSYLTIAIGCTGGQHRSVMIAQEIAKRLSKAGYRVKAVHRDCPR